MEHSPRAGSGWERTPWHATERAAWEALRREDTRPEAPRHLASRAVTAMRTQGLGARVTINV